jgi:predicted HicB family RNase H-like nuclease
MVKRKRDSRRETPAAPRSDPLVRLAVRIPQSLHQRLKVYAATSRQSMQGIVTGILSRSMDKGGTP